MALGIVQQDFPTKSGPSFIAIRNFSFARALGNNAADEAPSTSRTVRRFGAVAAFLIFVVYSVVWIVV
jgi:hypothetical protein